MPPLSTNQLESIRRLLLDPLRETIKAEIAQSHDRLASTLDRLAEDFATHADQTERRIALIDRELARQKSFRRKLAGLYAALTVLLSLAWSVARDKFLANFHSKD